MVLLILVGATGCLGLVISILYRRLCSWDASLPVTASWIEELSVDRYQPMMRLLDGDDLHFLSTRPGFTPVMAATFRGERCRIFQTYLRCLNSDFQQVCMALKIVMVQSRYDRPELAAVLVRSQRAFVLGLMMVHARLLFYRFGVGSVEVSGLLKQFNSARLELRALVPVQLGMAA